MKRGDKRQGAHLYGVLASLVLAGFSCKAYAETIPPAYFAGEYGFNIDGVPTVKDVSSPTVFSGTLSSSDSSGTASLNLAGTPAPSISVSSSSSGGSAGAEGQIVYQFRLVGADGPVPTTFSFSGGVDVTGAVLPSTAASSYFAIGSETGNPVFLSDVYSLSESTSFTGVHTLNGVTSALGTSYVASDTFDILANYTYSLNMSVYASSTGVESDSAYIDPIISIDPAYRSQYALLLSPGVGNAIATTPLPAALPLFVSALGGLGFVGWRQKRSA